MIVVTFVQKAVFGVLFVPIKTSHLENFSR